MVLFLKMILPLVSQHLTPDCNKMWCGLLSKFHLHNIVCKQTLHLLLDNREIYFKKQFYTINMLSNCKRDQLCSVMYYGIENYDSNNTNIGNHFFTQEDVFNIFNKFFPNPKVVPDLLCVRLDNFFMVTIAWFVRYVIETGNNQGSFGMDKFTYFYRTFSRERVPQYECDLLPFFYNTRVTSGIGNVIKLGLCALGHDHKAFRVEPPVVLMLLVMTHARLSFAVAPFLVSNTDVTKPHFFAAECINMMDRYDYEHIFCNDKLLLEDNPLFMSETLSDPDYMPHHLNTIRHSPRISVIDLNEDYDDYTYDASSFTSKGIEDLYFGRNPERTDECVREHSIETPECIDELKKELQDLARLANVNFSETFNVAKSTRSKMKKLQTQTKEEEENDLQVNPLTTYFYHAIEYDQCGRPKVRKTKNDTIDDDYGLPENSLEQQQQSSDNDDDDDCDDSGFDNSGKKKQSEQKKMVKTVKRIRNIIRKKIVSETLKNNKIVNISEIVLPPGDHDFSANTWNMQISNKCKTNDPDIRTIIRTICTMLNVLFRMNFRHVFGQRCYDVITYRR